ncbi:carbohydrate ABC transporter permease [Flexivirga caeni]|uniref:Carbohydrate ABC transporter permease n=1 Tax=Flexivirga caeni TaxID=2294115 RepID=A0A3M9M5R5_9MICO|nr:carbohydrate ABC transporter permease [Flexivirga caeni]RNI20856.1 carbohydrate ABC transporter permease [Flexivirga caeni]
MREPLSFKVFRVVVITVLSVFVLVPMWVLITSSVKPLGDVQGKFEWWPSHMTLQPFKDIWSTVPLAKYFLNSLIVCSISMVLSVIVAVFAGYAVSRWTFRGRQVFTTTILSTQMFPGILFLLPLFLIFVNIDKALGFTLLYQTRFGLVITYLTFSLPFAIWMLAGYFDGIPRELDEAARVDGASTIGTLLRVVLPAARPGVIAVAVYSFMTSWGEILFASQMTGPNTQTLSIGLQSYSTQINVYWNQVMAASLVVSLPIVLVFLLLQRFLVAGLTAGAVK